MVKLVREYDQAAAAGLAARRRLCCASRPAGGAAVHGSGHTALRRAVTRKPAARPRKPKCWPLTSRRGSGAPRAAASARQRVTSRPCHQHAPRMAGPNPPCAACAARVCIRYRGGGAGDLRAPPHADEPLPDLRARAGLRSRCGAVSACGGEAGASRHESRVATAAAALKVRISARQSSRGGKGRLGPRAGRHPGRALRGGRERATEAARGAGGQTRRRARPSTRGTTGRGWCTWRGRGTPPTTSTRGTPAASPPPPPSPPSPSPRPPPPPRPQSAQLTPPRPSRPG